VEGEIGLPLISSHRGWLTRFEPVGSSQGTPGVVTHTPIVCATLAATGNARRSRPEHDPTGPATAGRRWFGRKSGRAMVRSCCALSRAPAAGGRWSDSSAVRPPSR
jgi:hypothetical protein